MNRTILALLLLGLALAILHAPSFMLHLSIIAGLLTLTVKVFWATIQVFSQPKSGRRRVSV